MDFLEFSIIKSCHLQIVLMLLLPIQSWSLLFLFFVLIGLCRTSSAILNTSGETDILILFLNLGRKHPVFHQLSIKLSVRFSYMSLLFWGHFLLFLVCLDFLSSFLNHKNVLNFVKCCFSIYWDEHVGFFLIW